MDNDQLVEQFVEARDYLLESVSEKIEVFMTNIWDPLSKYIVIKETNRIIKTELTVKYPDLPEMYFPRCRFKIFEDEQIIEAGVQCYFNPEPSLNFLGTTEVGTEVYDMYYRGTATPYFDPMFIARYGHDKDSRFIGSNVAKQEYHLGAMTPLSVAYSMAVDDGLVE